MQFDDAQLQMHDGMSWGTESQGTFSETLSDLQVFLLMYTSEVYAMLARRLKIWPFPRAHHYFLTILPYRCCMFPSPASAMLSYQKVVLFTFG